MVGFTCKVLLKAGYKEKGLVSREKVYFKKRKWMHRLVNTFVLIVGFLTPSNLWHP